MNHIPNINKFGTAKRSNIKEIQGSEGRRSIFANALEIILCLWLLFRFLFGGP